MTQDLFRQDAYLQDCTARVVAVNEHGVVLDRTVFYPLGGGQAGDTGTLLLGDGTVITIADTRKAKDAEGRPKAEIVHVPADGQANAVDRLQPGVEVT
ncbi:MAG: Ala-tRNA(Pro) hydrolase, partial [Comamonadaceae bacterium]|nr:Ala-tRNA(Pro) hydrolase [Comamonadaceae bacterium]